MSPFNGKKICIARLLKVGRSGWNVVTSATDAEAQNFNLEQQAEHADRYRRAREFMDVVTGLLG